MKINVSGKEHEVKFGIRFIRNLDEIHYREIQGVKFGIGLEILLPQIILKRPSALVDAIFAGTKNLTITEVEDFIDGVAEKEGTDKLIDEVGKALGKAPLTKDLYAETIEMMETPEETNQ